MEYFSGRYISITSIVAILWLHIHPFSTKHKSLIFSTLHQWSSAMITRNTPIAAPPPCAAPPSQHTWEVLVCNRCVQEKYVPSSCNWCDSYTWIIIIRNYFDSFRKEEYFIFQANVCSSNGCCTLNINNYYPNEVNFSSIIT